MDDWKAKLGGLLAEGNLPEGPEANEATKSNPKPKTPEEALHVVMERKGRNGKTATIIEGFKCTDEELHRLAADLKRHLGCGGSARGGEILIQGNCVEKVRVILREKGYTVK